MAGLSAAVDREGARHRRAAAAEPGRSGEANGREATAAADDLALPADAASPPAYGARCATRAAPEQRQQATERNALQSRAPQDPGRYPAGTTAARFASRPPPGPRRPASPDRSSRRCSRWYRLRCGRSSARCRRSSRSTVADREVGATPRVCRRDDQRAPHTVSVSATSRPGPPSIGSPAHARPAGVDHEVGDALAVGRDRDEEGLPRNDPPAARARHSARGRGRVPCSSRTRRVRPARRRRTTRTVRVSAWPAPDPRGRRARRRSRSPSAR